jgi:class 3 adenylate cyclase/predicted ATPase
MDVEKPPHIGYRFDPFTLDLGRGALLASDGTELPLRPKSFALLQLLVENAGRLLDRNAIMSAVWPDVIVGDESITQCVRDIRRAFGDKASGMLRTVQRRGYLFAAAVSRADLRTLSVSMPNDAEETGRGDEPLAGQPSPHVASGAALSLASQRLPITSDLATAAEKHPPEPGQSELVRHTPTHEAERRHLTVLFCEAIGLNELSEQLDPEDMGGVISVYREHFAAAIARYGGHVASYASEGMLAFFGYPEALEDAAERSVRAGLAITGVTNDLSLDPGLAPRMRIGIATGLIVNGQTSERAREQLAVGKPLNLAARLRAIGKPGAVIIADSTRRLVGGLFDLEDQGRHPFPGFTTPVQAWRVIGESVAENRFSALRGANVTPLVGRRHELNLLLDRWEQTKESEGQVVLLAGEAGIGKSRLIHEFRDQIGSGSHECVGCYCSPLRQDSPLQPVIAYLDRAANFTRGDDPGQKLAKLETLLAQADEDVTRQAPLLASLLSISTNGRYPPCDMSPQQQRERTLTALVDQLVRLAAHRPVLLVCEDVHWADPTSLELLSLAIDRLQRLPVLALVTFRPDFTPPWPSHTHVTGLTLSRMSRRLCNQLIAGLTGGKSLPMEVLNQIAAKAEGVPLFVEELTKEVLESGVLREEDDRYELKAPLPSATIPATLRDLLMARLDRLAAAKEIAQVAAVIGREFSHDLLAAVISKKAELAEGLRCLIVAELVFRRGVAPYVSYVFKHTLVRDAAYASLLRHKRRQLHACVAQMLEEQFGQIVKAEPDVLAHHWAEAGVAENAAIYRLKAGERALANSATTEAVAQLTIGQELLLSLPDGDKRHRCELDLQIALGAAMSAAEGMASPRTARAYQRARELCDKLGEDQRLIPVLLGLWSSHNARDELGAARAAAAQLLQLAEHNGDRVASILGRRTLGVTLFGLGEFPAARTHLQELLALDCPRARLSAIPLPYDPCVSGRAWLALSLSVLGYPDQALAQSDKALAEADQLQHHNTTALVMCLRCSVGQFLRDHQDVRRHAEDLLAVAAKQEFAYWKGFGMYFRGWARAGAGETPVGIEEMRRGLAACQATGAQAYAPYNLALLADMCRRANDPLQGRKFLDEALDRLGQTDARYCESEMLCIDGELRLAMSRPDNNGAEASFQRAIIIARSQSAKVVELRATMGVARLWADGGKRRQAYELLAPIYRWFTEGFNTQHLIEARILMDSLA